MGRARFRTCDAAAAAGIAVALALLPLNSTIQKKGLIAELYETLSSNN